MATSGNTPTHKTSNRMAERAEAWAAGVAAARDAEARRVAALSAEREAEAARGSTMRDWVKAEQEKDGQR